MGAPHFDLIIFDCDGVLVDSETISNTVFADMLRDLGLDFTLDEMFTNFVGLSMDSCMREVARRLGREPPADFVERLRQRESRALAREVQTVDGIVELLDTLTAPFCVASSGEHEKMRITLGRTGLLPRFEGRIFSATEVPRGKPHPDVFLHAAQRMGAAPRNTAVVEDSPAGVTAGVTAGMTVFGYAAQTDAEKLEAAGAQVFHRMSDLHHLL